MTGDRSWGAIRFFGLAVSIWLAGTALAVFAARENDVPNNDEIYHLLAAASYTINESFAVGEGSYRRASLFTRYVALAFEHLGQSVESAKTSVALSFGALLAFIFCTLQGRAGWICASLTTASFALSPLALEFAATIRFYIPQSLLFWIGTWSIYRAVVDRLNLFTSVAVGATAWTVAFLLQPVTAVGVLAVVFWAMVYLSVSHRQQIIGFCRSLSIINAALLAGVLIAVVGGIFASGFYDAALTKYTSAARWNTGSSSRYYYWVMTENFTPFWALWPLACIVGTRRNASLVVYSSTVFAVSFVLLSFAGMKEDRYLLFALPFFFIPIALAIEEGFALARDHLTKFARAYVGTETGRVSGALQAIVVFALAFLVISNPGYVNAIKDIAKGQVKREQPRWDLVAAKLEEVIDLSTVVVTNAPNYPLYYIETLAVGMGASRLQDGSETGEELSTDRRTGALLMSKTETLESVLDCASKVVLIAEDRQWVKNKWTGFNADAVKVIESRMVPVDVPRQWGLRVFTLSNVRTESQDPAPTSAWQAGDTPDQSVSCETTNQRLAELQAFNRR